MPYGRSTKGSGQQRRTYTHAAATVSASSPPSAAVAAASIQTRSYAPPDATGSSDVIMADQGAPPAPAPAGNAAAKTKLKVSAKEFVPSFNLHATAPAWTPPTSFAPSAGATPPVVSPQASTKAPVPAAAAPVPAVPAAAAKAKPATAAAVVAAAPPPPPAPAKAPTQVAKQPAAPAAPAAAPKPKEVKKTLASVLAAPAPAPAAPAKPATAAAAAVAAAPASAPAKRPAQKPPVKPSTQQQAPAPVPAPAAPAPASAPPATAAAPPAPAVKAPAASAWGAKGGLSSAVRAAPPPMPAQPVKPIRSSAQSSKSKGGRDGGSKGGKQGGKGDGKGGRDGGRNKGGSSKDDSKQQQGGRSKGGDRRGGQDGKKGQGGRNGQHGGRQERQKSGGGRGQQQQQAAPVADPSEKKAAPSAADASEKKAAPSAADATEKKTAAAAVVQGVTKKEAPAVAAASAPAPHIETKAAPAPAVAPPAAAAPAAPPAAPAAPPAAPAPAPAAGGSWASLASKPGVPSAAQKVQQKPPQKPAQAPQQRQQSHGGSKGGQQRGEQGTHGHGHRQQHHDGGKQQQQRQNSNPSGWQRGNRLPAEMCKPGEGNDDAEKAVVRHVAKDLLAIRLSYLAPPLSWGDTEPGPPGACRWDDPKRVQDIDAMAKTPRMGGDVGLQQKRRRGPVETAPPLEDCKPLEVNDETRWKAGVFDKENKKEDEDTDEVVIKKALLILNKLSLTKFDKLSDAFIATGIGRNEKILHDVIWTIVAKAQDEPHFSGMYAALCLKLARTPLELEADAPKKGKKFKKLLLERCQEEFETDTAQKIAKATEGIDDDEEKAYKAGIVKKHYLGHMRFIGELYKGDLISIKIMLFCLPALLEGETAFSEESAASSSSSDEKKDSDEIDEEKVECFAKLMTTIGSSLEQQSRAMQNVGKTDASEKLEECWANVERMAGVRKDGHVPAVSNRIKFMLQDLLEMRKNGWVTRRKEETAKTIAQIHKEVAKEERAAGRRSSSQKDLRRLGSSSDVRRMSSNPAKPSIDKDGFVQVQPTFGRSMSMGNMHRSSSRGSVTQSPRNAKIVRKVSSKSSFAPLLESPEPTEKKGTEEKRENIPKKKEEKPAPAKVEHKSPEECGDKAKNILKEYFVGGDTDDAVLSFHELIHAGQEGSVDRGAKMVESAVLLVMEMKKEDVEKTLTVLSRLIEEKKIEGEALSKGLNDPLEFLSDIAIDAPLAGDHLAGIVCVFVKTGAIPLDFLLNAPEYFRTDGKAAHFAAKLLKKMGTEDDAASLDVVEKLMTSNDKEAYATAKDLLASC